MSQTAKERPPRHFDLITNSLKPNREEVPEKHGHHLKPSGGVKYNIVAPPLPDPYVAPLSVRRGAPRCS